MCEFKVGDIVHYIRKGTVSAISPEGVLECKGAAVHGGSLFFDQKFCTLIERPKRTPQIGDCIQSVTCLSHKYKIESKVYDHWVVSRNALSLLSHL